MCLHGPIIRFQRQQAWLALWIMCDGRKPVGKETQVARCKLWAPRGPGCWLLKCIRSQSLVKCSLTQETDTVEATQPNQFLLGMNMFSHCNPHCTQEQFLTSSYTVFKYSTEIFWCVHSELSDVSVSIQTTSTFYWFFPKTNGLLKIKALVRICYSGSIL